MGREILVIDDDAIMRRILVTILQKNHFEVTAVTGVPPALQYLERKQPLVICCDVMMPGLSGLDFLRHRQQDALLSMIPVIIITAAGEGPLMERARSLGAYACINKPFAHGHLVAVVQAAIESRTY